METVPLALRLLVRCGVRGAPWSRPACCNSVLCSSRVLPLTLTVPLLLSVLLLSKVKEPVCSSPVPLTCHWHSDCCCSPASAPTPGTDLPAVAACSAPAACCH